MRTLICTRLALAFVTCLAALVSSHAVHAGGWAIFTLDHVPIAPRAGEQIDLSFVARAHGRTPIDLPVGEATFVFTIAPQANRAEPVRRLRVSLQAITKQPSYYLPQEYGIGSCAHPGTHP